MTLLDLIADETADTEQMALEGILKEELPAAIAELKPQERDLMIAMYVKDEKMTLRQYARQSGDSRFCVEKRHKSALRKLRLHYRRKKLM